jgi:hypothetical protein
MQVTFYLTQASANTAAGPFNISGTTSGGALNTVLIQDGVTKQQLLDGYPKEVANNITGGTVTSTGATCNTTDTWDINELFVTPTPTPTEPPATGKCWTLDYDNQLPSDLYVRYASQETGETVTQLISGLESLDNGDGTFTAGICVKETGAYNNPVFVQGGVEVTGGSYTWNMSLEGTCSSNSVCLIN